VGKRSRKARPRTPGATPAGNAPAAQRPADGVARGYTRSRERDEQARAALEPLAPGERPLAVTIAAIVAALLAVANVAFYLAGWEVAGEDPKRGGVFVFAGILLAAAAGMWLRKYWAVLGFEVLLGITVIYAGLSLLFPSNWQAVVLAVGVLLAAGTLFWFLIRAMARLQMPER
jgi:hypothetical protein